MAYLYRRGNVWWANISVNGRRIRLTTECTKRPDAEKWAKAKEGKLVGGEPTLPRADRVKYDEAAADLRSYYVTSGARDPKEAGWRLARLDRYFTGRRLAAIGPADSTVYAQARQGQGASNATINRELAVLGRMLRLAHENNKLLRLPMLRKLEEAAPRSGFFEADQYEAVRRRLPEDARVACDLAYTFGWRMQSEVLPLEWRHVDLRAATVRLEPGSTKNHDGRMVYLTPALLAALAAQRERVKALEKRLDRIIKWVFPHLKGAKQQSVGLRHVRVLGERRQDLRRCWLTACKAAGVPGRLKHDFRRTAVRNLERSGVSRSVATKITGHRTEAVYRRYAIVNDQDLREAAAKLAVAHSRSTVADRAGQDGRK
jgi:integrase